MSNVMVDTEEIVTLSDAIERFCDRSPHYGRWDFESAAPFLRMGVIEGADGSFVSSDTWGDNYYNTSSEKALTVTNARAIRDLLNEAAEDAWEYGPADTFVYDMDNAAVVAVVERIESRLADYPLLDEEGFSEMEYEEDHPSETECYNSDPDCGCPVKSHECSEMFRDGVWSEEISATDDEWYCMYCSEWYPIKAPERERMRVIEYQREMAALEAAGQGRLFD